MRPIFGLALVVLFLSGCAQPRMTQWDAAQISAISHPVINLRNTEGEIATTVSRSLISTLLDIFRKLERVAGLSGVQLLITDPKEPNAFAIADTSPKIGLTVGMLNLLGRDYDAYAAILGHELAHLTLSHGAARKDRDDVAKGINAVVGNVIDAFVPFGGLMTSLAVTAVTKVYSRDEERHADSKGMEYMVAAGFDPEGAVRLWQKMNSAGAGATIPFLSTHPMSSERIENMQALVAATKTNQTSNHAPKSQPPAANQVQEHDARKAALWRSESQPPPESGFGSYTFPNGVLYRGDFRDSLPHGHGITYSTSGKILQKGEWEKGVFVDAPASPFRATEPTSSDELTPAERMGGRAVAPSTEGPPTASSVSATPAETNVPKILESITCTRPDGVEIVTTRISCVRQSGVAK